MGLKVCPFLDTEGKGSTFVISSGRSMNLENNIKTTKIGGMSKLISCLNLTDKTALALSNCPIAFLYAEI